MSRRHWIELESGVVAIYAVAAILATWPLARLIDTAVSYPGDPLINSWILAWDLHALSASPSSIYHANTFHPTPWSLAFSENLFGLVPIAAMLAPFVSPLAVHNILLIAGFAFSAWGAWRMARTLGSPVMASITAGVVYGFIPWRFVHITHLQHVWGGWLPLLIAAFILYEKRPSWRSASIVALCFVFNGLSNLHYLVFGACVAGVACVLFAIARSDQWRAIVPLLTSLGLSTVVLIAILWPYRIVSEVHAFRGDAEETRRYSATIADWIGAVEPVEPERRVFPGWVAVTALLGVPFVAKRERRIWFLFALLLIGSGVLLSLGMNTAIYARLFEDFFVLSGIRAPARWAVLSYLGFAMLIAMICRTMPRPVPVVVALVAFLQVLDVPHRWYLMPERVSDVYAWMRDTELEGGVLELPIGSNDVYYLQGAATHFKPIVNGASGGAPSWYRKVESAFASGTIPLSLLDDLQAKRVSHLIIHSDSLGATAPAVSRWLKEGLQTGKLAYQGHHSAALTGDFVFSLGGSVRPSDPALQAFLEGKVEIYNDDPLGFVDSPAPGAQVTGPLRIRGWALSSRGVRRVRLWFANKACHVDVADLEPYPQLQPAVPQLSTAAARFDVMIGERPCGTLENDLLVEILDHGGRVTTLPHFWFQWAD
jgi:hypothetical protein